MDTIQPLHARQDAFLKAFFVIIHKRLKTPAWSESNEFLNPSWKCNLFSLNCFALAKKYPVDQVRAPNSEQLTFAVVSAYTVFQRRSTNLHGSLQGISKWGKLCFVILSALKTDDYSFSEKNVLKENRRTKKIVIPKDGYLNSFRCGCVVNI